MPKADDTTSTADIAAAATVTQDAAPAATTTLYTNTGPETVTEFAQGIEEFCANLSATDRRIEMIGAFYRVEMAAGRTRALPSEFKDRYSAFLTQPA
jgi:hypothetical protein